MRSSLLAASCLVGAVACGSRTELTVGTSTLDAGTLTGSDAHVSCGASPRVPAQLAALDPLAEPYALTVSGAFVYYGALSQPGLAMPTGAISRVSTTGGAPETVASSGYLSGPIAADGKHLYFMRGVATATGPGGWSYAYPDVLATAEGGGAALDLPSVPGQSYVSYMTTNGAPGVFWLAEQTDVLAPLTLARWDPATGMTRAVLTATSVGTLFADADRAYWNAIDGQDEVLDAAPLATGVPATLARFAGAANTGALVEILGLDASHVLYTPDANGGTIVRMDKNGANPTTIVNGPALGPIGGYVDDAWVYWTEQDRQERLVRAPIQGGAEEVISEVATEYVQAIASDACNVYWLVVNPPALYWRAK